eukprot:1658870-Prymnesium_polylepis.1
MIPQRDHVLGRGVRRVADGPRPSCALVRREGQVIPFAGSPSLLAARLVCPSPYRISSDHVPPSKHGPAHGGGDRR